MSRHLLLARRAALALALAATPALSQDIHRGGALGAGYSASSADSLGSTPWSYSDWELIASLNTSGVLYSQQLLRWTGDVDYGTRRASLFGSSSIADRLTFGLTADALSGTRFPIGLRASRAIYDFTLGTGTGGPPSLGSSAVNTYGLNAGYLGQGVAPSFRLGLSRSDVDTRTPLMTSTLSSTTRLALGASQAVGPFNYDANYDTSWATGNRADLRYQLHNFNLTARTAIAPEADLLLYETYYLRLPTVVDPFNPRMDNNTVGATLQWRAGAKQSAVLGYQYNNAVASSVAVLDQTNVSHALNYTHSYQLNPELLVQGNAGAQYGLARSGASEVRGFGQTVGSAAWWKRPLFGVDTTLGGRANFGLVERRGDPLGFQWGTAASAAGSRAFGIYNTSASYEIGYQRGGVTLVGWTLTQLLRADCQAPLGPSASASLGLLASASRRTDRLFGSGFSRNVALTGSATWLAYTGRLSAGIYDGLAPNLAAGGVADGLFLPPSFDTHTRYVTAELSATMFGNSLQLVLVGRLASIEAPGIRPQAEQAVTATAYYSIGLVNLSLDYRFQVMSFDGRWSRSNAVFARVTRSFQFL